MNLEVEDAIDLDLDIILGDGGLIVNIDDLLLQTVVIAHLIDEWQLEAETRFQNLIELSEALQDLGFLLMRENVKSGVQRC